MKRPYRRSIVNCWRAGSAAQFTGYQTTYGDGTVAALLKAGVPVEAAGSGEEIEIVCTQTPFYGESGGQVGDRGRILAPGGELEVLDSRKPLPELTVHAARVVSGTIHRGDAVNLQVDAAARQATALNHTATHILQAALIEVLGDHVKQAGSLVTPERLRFDFTHFSALSATEIAEVERRVNARIRQNQGVAVEEMAADAAIAAGATALFGEKYGDQVRVVKVGDFSMELCGGTHTQAAGDIGLFKIVQESGIAAGVRRIEAVTGARALTAVQQQEEAIDSLARLLKSEPAQLEPRLQRLLERQKELEREVETLQARLNANRSLQLLDQAVAVAGVPLLAARVDGLDGKQLRELADQLRERLGSGVIALGAKEGDKASLLVAVTRDLTARVQAGALIKPLAETVGGRGGGRPDLAQAGGNDPSQLDAALARAPQLLAELLG